MVPGLMTVLAEYEQVSTVIVVTIQTGTSNCFHYVLHYYYFKSIFRYSFV